MAAMDDLNTTLNTFLTSFRDAKNAFTERGMDVTGKNVTQLGDLIRSIPKGVEFPSNMLGHSLIIYMKDSSLQELEGDNTHVTSYFVLHSSSSSPTTSFPYLSVDSQRYAAKRACGITMIPYGVLSVTSSDDVLIDSNTTYAHKQYDAVTNILPGNTVYFHKWDMTNQLWTYKGTWVVGSKSGMIEVDINRFFTIDANNVVKYLN